MEDLLLKVKHALGLLFAVTCLLGSYVHACSVVDYEAKCKGCVNTFVDGLQDPSTNCSIKYASLRECISSERTRCLATPGISTSTKHMIRQRSMLYTASEEFFCVDGMFNSLKNYKREALPMCKAKFFRKVSKCRARFSRRFMKNRGSGALCRHFYKAKQCMLSALTRHCKKSKFIPQLLSNYKQSYNPYCKSRTDSVRRASKGSSDSFGRCTQKSYVIKSRECIKDFIHSLQRNGGMRCRATVDSVLLPCISTRMKRCLRGTRDAKVLDQNIKQGLEAQRVQIYNQYCEGGFLETLPLTKGQCSEEYFETFQRKCYAKFIAKFRENKADPLLCRYYAKAKKCARNMTTSHCNLDESMRDAVGFVYGDFNPFCQNGRDPERQSNTEGTHNKQTTSSESRACTSHTWGLTSLVALFLSTLLLR